jgi:mannose-6-phosphate isomerase
MRQLLGSIQPYQWGSVDLLPRFLRTEPTGEPQAELWLGAHAQAPSRIGEKPLDAAIAADPAGWIGAESCGRFGPRLSYLMKVLAVAQPLSLQAHPNRAQAEAGFARESAAGISSTAPNRSYRDDWPKPEAICALDTFDTLCGFREPSQTFALFDQLGVSAAIDLVQPLRGGNAAELARVFSQLLRMRDASGLVTAVVDAATECTAGDGALGDIARTAVEISAHHPGDSGVLAALMMNRIRLRPHQAIFVPPGNLHAHLSGIGVEIMANSDNVLRGGLTGKHIDVEELLTVVDFTPGFAGVVSGAQTESGVFSYRSEADEFALWRLEADGESVDAAAAIDVPATGHGRIALVSDGQLTFHAAAGPAGSASGDHRAANGFPTGVSKIDLNRGESCFLQPGDRVQVTGYGTAFVASPGPVDHYRPTT